MRLIKTVSCLVAAISIVSCGGPIIRVRVLTPAEMNIRGIRSLSVLPLEVPTGVNSSVGREVSDKITVALVANGFLEILERQRLDTVLGEQGLWATGAGSEDDLQKLGQLLGADGLLLGSITRYSSRDTGERGVRKHRHRDPETKEVTNTEIPNYTIQRVANVEIIFRVADASTGRIVAAVTQRQSSTSQASVDIRPVTPASIVERRRLER